MHFWDLVDLQESQKSIFSHSHYHLPLDFASNVRATLDSTTTARSISKYQEGFFSDELCYRYNALPGAAPQGLAPERS